LQDFLDKIDKLLFRYTHLGGNLIKPLKEVQFHAIELFDYLQIMENIRTTAIETYDRELQSQAKRLLLEIRQCLIEARTIRNEPIEG
jgi:hypothetical protein